MAVKFIHHAWSVHYSTSNVRSHNLRINGTVWVKSVGFIWQNQFHHWLWIIYQLCYSNHKMYNYLKSLDLIFSDILQEQRQLQSHVTYKSDYICRMQKPESVDQILLKAIRDLILSHQSSFTDYIDIIQTYYYQDKD